MKEETFTGRGGTRLHMRSWRPAGTPRAAVVLCHGILAHSGQYTWSGEQDLGKEQVMADVVGWINARVA
ncbi:MAG TPA: hypothetical protein VL242_21665 [Sorangium sp.]|nr:hypothetical protein [Sorangium sp.]